jgi:AbrB family looped-hinge helix DNA binding protein
MHWAHHPSCVVHEGTSSVANILTVKSDARGRITIPRYVREKLGVESGNSFFLEVDDALGVLQFTKVENPFDILAEQTVAEYRAGRTKSLRDFAIENAIALDDEEPLRHCVDTGG